MGYKASDKDGDTIFVSDSEIEYSVYEGVTMGIEPKTSDIIFIMLDGYDTPTQLVHWAYGANVMGDEEVQFALDKIEEFEENNPDLVKEILNGTIEKF